ncbi:stalk domain-containing protein [[Clostridium] colinum]|uniref:stalk domain-containing protein n=1 Tax=[Clostridium] colinum TaxID=36835 RepID=UPI002025984B|nr:PepSY domain-containing protein [[Clostridium] colinum]
MKKFISGLLIGGIITTSVTAFAANMVNMQAVYSIKSLIVNGVDTGKGNTAFVSNGTTYVPLRTVSDALGHKISWDSNTKTIYINTNDNVNNSGEPTDLPPVNNNSTPNKQGATSSSNNSWKGKKLISIETAKNAAIKAVGGGNVISQESDINDNDDLPTYDFKISKNNKIYEVEVNALTGQVKDFDID